MGEVFSTTDHLGNSVYCTNKQWYGHIIKNHSIMAKNMDGDDILASSIVVVTTLLSSVTLTFWIFVLRAMDLIR